MRAFAILVAGMGLTSCASINDAMKQAGYGGLAGAAAAGLSDIPVDSALKVGSAIRKSAEQISESEEYFIGRAVAAKIATRYRTFDNAELNRYAQTVLQVVAMASDRPAIYRGYHIQLLDSEEVNAFSAPGGFVFITTGLLKTLESEDQLACVLGHEVAHIAKKHGLKTIKAARLTAAFTLLGKAAADNYASGAVSELTEHFGGAVDDIVNNLVVSGYSRDKEFEADHYGDLYAQRAAYDPGALDVFLTKLGAADARSGFYKTHPPAEKRLRELAGYSISPLSTYRKSSSRDARWRSALAAL